MDLMSGDHYFEHLVNIMDLIFIRTMLNDIANLISLGSRIILEYMVDIMDLMSGDHCSEHLVNIMDLIFIKPLLLISWTWYLLDQGSTLKYMVDIMDLIFRDHCSEHLVNITDLIFIRPMLLISWIWYLLSRGDSWLVNIMDLMLHWVSWIWYFCIFENLVTWCYHEYHGLDILVDLMNPQTGRITSWN